MRGLKINDVFWIERSPTFVLFIGKLKFIYFGRDVNIDDDGTQGL